MNIRSITLPVSLNLAHALLLAAEQLSLKGRGDLAGACQAFAGEAGATKISMRFTLADVIAAGCDSAQAKGDTEMAKRLHELTILLKEGDHATIRGTINRVAGRTPGELDGAIEDLRDQMIRQAGG
jgi:hypothetical protein